MATIFVPKEVATGERRVAATPDTVRRLVKDGHRVLVESGAGEGAYLSDTEFGAAGATVESASAGWSQADVVLLVSVPTQDQVRSAREGSSFVSFLWPLENLDLVRAIAERRMSAFAMDEVPRSTRAQKDDALTSQGSLAGYKAVLLAAAHLPKIFPLQMTPAGTLRPAKVLILGAGVAGLQAIATARRLGALVEVSDIRPEVKEQVQSLGAQFLEVEGAVAAGKGGYAAEQSEDFRRRQREMLHAHLVAADVVITTALVPYKPAPKLVSREVVAAMRPGSVIVDLAAERGGNCELTEPRRTVVRNGVTIVGEVNLPSTLPTHASEQYARNVQNVVSDATKKGAFAWDLADDIVAAALVVHAGEFRHARTREALGLPPLARADLVQHRDLGRPLPRLDGEIGGPVNGMILLEIYVFVLACFAGYQLISKVPPTLHTPLMSGANAISGITILGAMVVAQVTDEHPFGISTVFGFFAVALANINVVGGFWVTERMLQMFKKKD